MIHTAESLKRRALRTGASVEIEGKTFNASHAVAPYVEPTPPPPPSPPATPQPTEAPKPADRMPEIAALMHGVARAVQASAQATEGVQQALESLKFPAADRPTKWTWTVIRDREGRIQRIEATSE